MAENVMSYKTLKKCFNVLTILANTYLFLMVLI